MKKLILCITALALLASCAPAPGGAPDTQSRWIEVYYENTDGSSMIASDEKELDIESGILSSVRHALELMRTQPAQTNLRPSLPQDITVRALRFENNVLYLDLSSRYNLCTPLEKTVFEACLAMTMANFWNIDRIILSIDGVVREAPLEVRGFALTVPGVISGERELSVFLSDPETAALCELKITAELDGEVLPERTLADALVHGIEGSRLVSPLPSGTVLQSLNMRAGVCYMSFSPELLTCPDDDAALTLVRAVVCTMTSLDYVDAVQLLVDGEAVEGFKTIDLRRTYSAENFRTS